MSKPLIEIWPPGTEVITKVGTFQGIISSVQIHDLVRYEISYICNGQITSAWMSDFEFLIKAKGEKRTVGFLNS